MWHEVISAVNVEDVLSILAEKGSSARVIAGGTDLLLEMERGQRKGIDTLVDISRIPGLDTIRLDNKGWIHLGPLVTHNHCAASRLLQDAAYPLVRAAWEVGSPQIRNRGTVAGNLITASPANDTITPLVALGAVLTIRSLKGERTVRLDSFYKGVRQVDLHPDELLTGISFPSLKANQRGTFIKFALRRAQAISLVNAAVILTFDGDLIEQAVITLGAVAPTIIHATAAENFLRGKKPSEDVIQEAARLAMEAARPISDIRGSALYRKRMVGVIVRRAIKAILSRTEREEFPPEPVLLRGRTGFNPSRLERTLLHDASTPIETTINGKPYRFTSGQDKNLLRLLREEGAMIGTKEGCAEGECGACTVFLDGAAVMSCLVPAVRAHGASIVTIEGLAGDDRLHPVQEAFIKDGAIQCGYCIPGFVMSAAKLLEERPAPSQEEIKQAITGNLCRCTGYYKIVQAIEDAALIGQGENR